MTYDPAPPLTAEEFEAACEEMFGSARPRRSTDIEVIHEPRYTWDPWRPLGAPWMRAISTGVRTMVRCKESPAYVESIKVFCGNCNEECWCDKRQADIVDRISALPLCLEYASLLRGSSG